MLEIIAHRGYWRAEKEKNSEAAFLRAFESGFGIETDIRDFKGGLVISHDIPGKAAFPLAELLSIYSKHGRGAVLALNIKADGLQRALMELLKKFSVKRYFVFDMSFPEQLAYTRSGFKVFSRQSEYEQSPLLYKNARGVWLDEFDRNWIRTDTIAGHRRRGKEVCLVSPELHKRPHLRLWRELRRFAGARGDSGMALCTDLPEEARAYFYEKN